MNKFTEEVFAWMNPISGMFTDNSGFTDWRGHFDATKDLQVKWNVDGVMSLYIVRDDFEDWEVIILGQWDFTKKTGWHSSDLKEEG